MLTTATEHALAATTALGKPLAEEASPSWQAAAFDIHLRQGMVSLVDGRFDAATQALDAAKLRTPKPPKAETPAAAEHDALVAGIDRMSELANKRSPLIPADAVDTGGSPISASRTDAALALGSLNLLLRRFEAAQRFFALAAGATGKGTASAPRAYAAFGLARAQVAINSASIPSSNGKPLSPLEQRTRVARVESLYQQSLKDFPRGSWHDQTLHELALYTERIAAERYGPPTGVNAADNPQAKALRAARAEALPHWLDLVKRFPESPHAAQALYHAGVLHGEAEQSEKALALFDSLVKNHPQSRWTGDAAILLIDVRLEQQFDLPGAAAPAATAVAWYETWGKSPDLPDPQAIVPWDSLPEQVSPHLRNIQESGYHIYLRAGLVEYLRDRKDAALAYFEKAKPLTPPRDYEVVQGHIPTGLEKLIEVAKTGKVLTPDEARKGDEKAKLILMLADVYFEGEEWDKSYELCTKVLAGVAKKASAEQLSWAYFKRGRAVHAKLLPLEAVPEFRAAARAAKQVPWAPTALFYIANTVFNYERKVPQAISMWQYIAAQYPKSREAEQSSYYIGFALQHAGRLPEAQAAYEAFLKKYPDSAYCRPIRQYHLPELSAPQPPREAVSR